MDPFSWERGWEPGTDAEEIRRVAAVRHRLLSEFYEAPREMVILPGWGDLQTAVEAVLEKWLAVMYYHPHLPILRFLVYPRRTEAEEVYSTIQELRREIWRYTVWSVRIWAEEHHFIEMFKTVLDRADKLLSLSSGKTILDGYGQITEGKNTVRVVSHKQEDSLDALSDGMVQFSDKTKLNRSADIMNGSYPINMPKYWSTICKNQFYADSGANIHATGNRNLISKLTSVKAGTLVKTADVNSHLMSHGCGYVSSVSKPCFTIKKLGAHTICRINRANKFLYAGKTTLHGQALMIPIRGEFTSHTMDTWTAEEFRDAIVRPASYKNWTSSVVLVTHEAVHDPFCVKTSPKGSVDIKNGSYPIHVPKYCSVRRPIAQLAPSCCIIECVTVRNSIVGPYESGRISEKPKPQSTITGLAFKDVHGLTDAQSGNHRMFLASIDPIDKMERQPWRDCTLMSWAARQILLLACLYTSVTFMLRSWTVGILGDPTVPFKHEDQTSFVRSEVRSVSNFYITHARLILGPKFRSVHRPLAQMVLFSTGTLYGGTLACLKSIVPKSIVNLYESGRISEKPKTWSTSTGSACRNADDLTAAEPGNHGAPYSSDHGITKAEDKTAATWLIDTGAVHHATGKLSLLSGVTGVNDDDFFITARDGVRMRVCARGSVITDTVVLPDVWYIPGLIKNVVSAAQLNQLGYNIGFSRGTCFIRSATDGRLIGKGHVSQDGLFEMDFLKVS